MLGLIMSIFTNIILEVVLNFLHLGTEMNTPYLHKAWKLEKKKKLKFTHVILQSTFWFTSAKLKILNHIAENIDKI